MQISHLLTKHCIQSLVIIPQTDDKRYKHQLFKNDSNSFEFFKGITSDTNTKLLTYLNTENAPCMAIHL